eukprot:gb/GFBE01061683.1/.p1 GENE.gb/GFBE01061683.1/~~gb/GFBE01061683.1/.p1  ORF type:complete len:136 (+),score=11.54 gb/GFBE01061683.1/:1-408(+)
MRPFFVLQALWLVVPEGVQASAVLRREDRRSPAAVNIAHDGTLELQRPIQHGSSMAELRHGIHQQRRVNVCAETDRYADCTAPENDQKGGRRIAVYTYVVGGYEAIRDTNVPCVPAGVDAFFFVDDYTKGVQEEA